MGQDCHAMKPNWSVLFKFTCFLVVCDLFCLIKLFCKPTFFSSVIIYPRRDCQFVYFRIVMQVLYYTNMVSPKSKTDKICAVQFILQFASTIYSPSRFMKCFVHITYHVACYILLHGSTHTTTWRRRSYSMSQHVCMPLVYVRRYPFRVWLLKRSLLDTSYSSCAVRTEMPQPVQDASECASTTSLTLTSRCAQEDASEELE